MTVQEKLKKLRSEKNFTEKDVAEILGMKLDSYSRLEHGVGKIGSFLQNKLALLYDREPEYFTDDPENEPELEDEIEEEIEEEPDEDIEEEPVEDVYEELEEDAEEIGPADGGFEEPGGLSVDIPDALEELIMEKDPEEADAILAEVTVESFGLFPDVQIKAGEKEKLRAEKKAAWVTVSDESIAKVKTKGKKIKIKGKKPGVVTVTAYDKKDRVIGNWIVKIE